MSETGQAASSKDKQLDVRLMTPEQRAMAAMILADATPERTQDAAGHAIKEFEGTEGSAIFIAWLEGLPIAAYVLTPAQMSVEMPLIAVRPEMRRKGIGRIIAQDAVRRAGVKARVETRTYERPSYTGLVYPTRSYFPTWVEREDAPQVQAAAVTYRELFRRRPRIGRWTFSTNGVSINGMFGIPCVGFGPAEESVAHTVNDSVAIEQLVQCAAFYAAFPSVYCGMRRRTN